MKAEATKAKRREHRCSGALDATDAKLQREKAARRRAEVALGALGTFTLVNVVIVVANSLDGQIVE